MRILVVDDDVSVANVIGRVLAEDGYAVDVATTGEEGRLLANTNDYDGIILDLELGDRHGFEILQELRRRSRPTPVLLYTGNAATDSVVRGLDAGADGYLIKPVTNKELRARVRVLVRRGQLGRSDEQVRVGDLLLNRLNRRVSSNGADLDLTATEIRLLEHFMLHSGEVVTRSQLHEGVWDQHMDPSSNVIDAHVARLRKKLAAAGTTATISTRRGLGFMLGVAPSSERA